MNLTEQKALLKQLEELAKATKPPKRKIKVDILVDTDNTPAPNAFERMREAYAVMKACFEDCMHALKVAEQNYEALPLPAMGDLLCVIRQTRDFGEGLRKEYDALIDTIERVICERHFSNASQETPIKGEYCSFTPKYRPRFSMPTFDKEPEIYAELMDWLQVPEDLRNRGRELYAGEDGEFRTEVVKIDYLGFRDMIEKYQRMGYAMPPCVEACKVNDEPVVILRKTEDLL